MILLRRILGFLLAAPACSRFYSVFRAERARHRLGGRVRGIALGAGCAASLRRPGARYRPGARHLFVNGACMAGDSLFRICSPGTHELIVRKSRFLALAAPAESHEAAQVLLAGQRAGHPKANHHVSAWRIADLGGEGSPRIEHRFDDDGEPGGTAGRPLLQVLEGRSLVGAAVVVVRYFGGIKLGAGGLVRAYGEAAAHAADAARIEEIIPKVRLRLTVPFDHLAAVETWAQRHGIEIEQRDYQPEPCWTVVIPASEEAQARAVLRDLSQGTVRIDRVGSL